MGSSSSLYLLQPVEYLKTLVFSLFGLHSYHCYCSPLNHLDFSHTYFLWCTELQTAKDSLAEILTIHTTTEELVWKGCSAILAKFNFVASGKCWAGTASALERTRDGINVEEKKKNLGYCCHCLCCHQGVERSGAALSYYSSVVVVVVFFICLFCVSVVLLTHIQFMIYCIPKYFFLKKILYSQLFSIFHLYSCRFVSWCGTLCYFWLNYVFSNHISSFSGF